MTTDQLHSLDEMLRTGPLDLGGDLQEQRRLLVELLTAFPLPGDVRTAPGDLGGVPVITVDYRLAPEHPYPAALDDAVATYTALLETTDPADVVLVGESAGGGRHRRSAPSSPT